MQNFEENLKKTYGSIEKSPQQLIQKYEQWKTIRSEIGILNEEKKIRSAEIGRLKKSGQEAEDKIRSLSKIKKSIKEMKHDLRSLEQEIEQLISQGSSEVELPARFLKQTSESLNTEYRVVSTGEIDDDLIDQFTISSNQSSLYHMSCWRRLICDVFGHKDISLVAIDTDHNIVGLLPLIHMQSRLFGNFACSLPFFNYGGPVSLNESISKSLVDKAIEFNSVTSLEHIELREMSIRSCFETKSEKVCMIRRLPKSIEALDNELGTKLRAQIKRSQNRKPEFVAGKTELLDDFYHVFSINMRDLGTPVYTRKFFQKVIDAWNKDAHVVVVYLEKKPVAAAILLGFKDTLEIPWASALKSTNSIGINMFMYWKILCFAISSGYGFFDFGRSSVDSGTYRFKQQWGAKPLQNHWNYWLPDNAKLPQINPNNPKYRLVISLWKRLPIFLTNLMGPYIVRSIP